MPTSCGSRAELIAILVLIDKLHDETRPAEGAFFANAFADELRAAEPTAHTLEDDFTVAIAVGLAMHRLAQSSPELVSGNDTVAPVIANALSWAAMEQAADAPERHGPWLVYATHLGYVLARRGAGEVRVALNDLTTWRTHCPPMTHSAYFDQRLVLDIGAGTDGSVVARNYLPPRPAGIEHAHDTLLFQTACDDFTERLRGQRVHGTTRHGNLFRVEWKPTLV